MSATQALQHINILVDNLEEGVAFYRDIVGLTLDETPALDFPAQFFKLSNGAQIHMNEFAETRPFRAHFCLVVDDFNGVFRRLDAAGAIDIEPWGKGRRLPSGSMQMFARDPSGNLLEIASLQNAELDADVESNSALELTEGNELFVSGRNDQRRGTD